MGFRRGKRGRGGDVDCVGLEFWPAHGLSGLVHAFPDTLQSYAWTFRGFRTERRGTAHPLPKIFVFYVLFVLCSSVY